jgi:hypothetical protein
MIAVDKTKILIKEAEKPDVLMALYNAARLQTQNYAYAKPMTRQEALQELKKEKRFGLFKGKALHVDLTGSSFDPWLYDKYNGTGKAEEVIKKLHS